MSKREGRRTGRQAREAKPQGISGRGIVIGLVVLAVVFLVAWSALRSQGVLERGNRPRNLLLITLDTTRADHLSCYGGDAAQTPNLDRVAREGTLFARCASASPITLPSHASILTGLYPYAHGARLNGTGRLAESVDTLTEQLKAAGFATQATVASFVLNRQFGTSQGFDVYHDVEPQLGGALLEAERKGDDIADDAIAMLDVLADDRFFLWVHFYDPHHPYESATHADTESPLAYADEVEFMDAQVGRVLDKLRSLELEAETLIVVVGDHGEGLGQHNELRHGYFLYDTVIHVPFLMRYPGLVPGEATVGAQVRTIDIAPTILDLMGIEELGFTQGISLRPLIDGEQEELGLAGYSEALNAHVEYGLCILRGWSAGEWKYILAPTPELYHLSTDPDETDNVAPRHTELAGELRSEMRQLIADAPPPPAPDEASSTLSAEELARLESLGYVGSSSSSMEDETISELERFEPTGGDPKDFALDFQRIALELSHLQATEQYEDAEALLVEMIDKLPEASRLRIHLASVLTSQGRIDDAIGAYEAAIELSPDDLDVRRKYATFLAENGQYRNALEHFEIVVGELPDDLVALMDAAQVHTAIGEYEEAETLLNMARRVDPRDARAVRLLGRLREEQGQLQEAVKLFNEALGMNPNLTVCRQDLQRVRAKLGW